LLIVHDLNNKSSQAFDFKIQDYCSAIGKPNLEVENKIVAKSAYISDAIFPEEIEALESEVFSFKGLKNIADKSDVSKFDIEAENDVENSKEFVDFKFKLDFSGEDDSNPVSAKLDVGGEKNQN
jgi:hypothetical protein